MNLDHLIPLIERARQAHRRMQELDARASEATPEQHGALSSARFAASCEVDESTFFLQLAVEQLILAP